MGVEGVEGQRQVQDSDAVFPFRSAVPVVLMPGHPASRIPHELKRSYPSGSWDAREGTQGEEREGERRGEEGR